MMRPHERPPTSVTSITDGERDATPLACLEVLTSLATLILIGLIWRRQVMGDGMRRASGVGIWGLALTAELLLMYDLLLINMGSLTWFPDCGVGSGPDPYPCTPFLPPLTLTVPTGAALFSNGLLILLLALLMGLPAWIIGPKLARRRGASARTPILIASLPASACAILAAISVLARYPVLAATETCFWPPQPPNQPAADPPCMYGYMAVVLAILGVAALPLLATCILSIPAWVMGLAEADGQQRWGWFIAVLFFSPVATALYGLFGGSGKGAQPPALTTAAGPSPG